MSSAQLLKELMEQFNINRAKWIERNGTDAGFNQWFTQQVAG